MDTLLIVLDFKEFLGGSNYLTKINCLQYSFEFYNFYKCFLYMWAEYCPIIQSIRRCNASETGIRKLVKSCNKNLWSLEIPGNVICKLSSKLPLEEMLELELYLCGYSNLTNVINITKKLSAFKDSRFRDVSVITNLENSCTWLNFLM